MEFDDRRTASLDGEWDFFGGDHKPADLASLTPKPIRVPGLWESQGWLDLDGVAWYRRRFTLGDTSGYWTLRFGAVMDLADVFLNGIQLGSSELAFTPFEFDATPALVPGWNELTVRVVDPSLNDPEHLRMAHGKQGWANHVFPSRPSLYMTYGGIWQPVTLRRHGPVAVRDVFVNADPDDLCIVVDIENCGPSEVTAILSVRTLGLSGEAAAPVAPRGFARVESHVGPTTAPRWRPDDPVLHHAVVDVRAAGELSDTMTVRYGLRAVRIQGERMVIDGEPYRMRSALVQGFRADTLYAEGNRRQIEEEVAAARAMGFNTLRLHIKAFDPTYLEVCDETGMLLHCDIPVAEPIAHEEMGDDTALTRRAVAAARAQVRRDRNHPSVVLWSAMNEICDGRREARAWPAYEQFVRAVAGAVRDEDPTRPAIENDWVDPDPGEVFLSPILTAHWYGRLHRDYLDKIEAACARWSGEEKLLFVSEFGDWGLPDMPVVENPPFWDPRESYAAALVATLWPGTIARFVWETQRYQGLSDRLQAEVFRRHDHIGGYCLTELTDVPQELNGLLDLERRPKVLAVEEVARANQVTLPILRLYSLVVPSAGVVRVPLHVANDAGSLTDVEVEVRFGESVPPASLDDLLSLNTADLPPEQVVERFRETVSELRLGDVAGHTTTYCGDIEVVAPDVPGSHDLVVRMRSGDLQVAENRYPIHVVDERRVPAAVRVLGRGPTAEALARVGASVGDHGLTVVAEGGLDEGTGAEVSRRLATGEVVVVLAQPAEAAPYYPLPVELGNLATVWGSTLFIFTTDHGAVPSLPRRAVLAAEDSTIHATAVLTRIGEHPFPDTPVVIGYKPVPGALTGTVVGSHPVDRGRLVFCQYRLAAATVAGDPAACALLTDVIRWATVPRQVIERDDLVKDDGRRLYSYYWLEECGR